MLQIKTIRNRLDNNTYFDDEVNAALRDGWTLKKRTVLRPISQQDTTYTHMMLYAELEMEVADDDAEWLKHYGFPMVQIQARKVPSIVYVDDRTICFDGRANNLYEQIINFKPWYERESESENR